MKKTTIISILMIIGLLTNVSFAGVDFNTIETRELEIKEGKLTKEIEMQNCIDNYFENRIMVFDKKNSKKSYKSKMTKVFKNYTKVAEKEENRLKALDNLAEYHGVHVINAKNIKKIKSIKKKDDKNKSYDLEIYEWTWIDYNDGKGGKVDKLGYATEHVVTIEEGAKGEFFIVSDDFDESDFLGEKDTSTTDLNNSNAEVPVKSKINLIKSNGINSNKVLDLSRLIRYADEYVKHDYNGDYGVPLMFTDYYNLDVYGYYDGADCANYVSQCLRNGGMSMDYGSGKDSGNWDGTQWWFDRYPSSTPNSEEISPPSWRYVPKFIVYWENQGYSNVSANDYNVFPGNPVLDGTSHVTICVGYNSAGKPIINGHNRDAYHVPYTMGGNNLTTIQIADENNFINKPSSPVVIYPSSTTQSISMYLNSNECDYFKFDASSYGWYIFETNSNLDTYGYLYKESVDASDSDPDIKLYMYEISKNDDSGPGSNFQI